MKILISPDYEPGLPDEVYALATKMEGFDATNIPHLDYVIVDEELNYADYKD